MPAANEGVRPPSEISTRSAQAGAVAAAFLVVALLLLERPYHGIWHDSVLYLGQALAVLDPGVFRQDLFFAYGSQSSYSLVQYLLAPLVGGLGSSASFWALTVLGLCLFLYASWRLLSFVLPSRQSAYAGTLALVVLPGSYGAWNSLSYAEPFFTGRSLAEPLALLGLAAIARGRTAIAFSLFAIGTAFNPLQVLPALVAAWMWLVQDNRRWLHLAWLGLLASAVAMLLPDAHGLFARMDPVWFGQVWERNLVVFYSHSQAGDWYYLLTDVVVVSCVAKRATGLLRRFAISVGVAWFLLFTASLVLADVAHFAWPAGLQLWRAHWLLHWSAMATLPWLAMEAWRSPGERPWFVLLLALVVNGTTPSNAHPLVPGIALLIFTWPWLARQVSLPTRWLVACGCLAVGCWHLIETWAIQEQAQYWWPLRQWPSPLLQSWLPVLTPSLAIAGPLCWRHAGASGRRLLMAGAGMLLAASCLQWDQRTHINRAFTTDAPANPFGLSIPHDSTVQWIGGLLPTWNILHRAHYLDQQQLAGIVFNRATATEGFRRKELLHVTDRAGRDCRIVTFQLEPHAACNPDLSAMRRACDRTRGALDYFVLPYRLPIAPLGTWSPLGPDQPGYHLYACRDALATMGASTGARRAGPSR